MRVTAAETTMLRGLLLGAAAVGVLWLGYAHSIEPLLRRDREDRSASAQLREQIARARAEIEAVRALENEAQAVRRQIDQLRRAMPEGSALVWMPEQLKRHFARFGLAGSTVRTNTMREEPDLPGFCRGYWSVGLPLGGSGCSAAGSFLAVAEFEQQHPFVRVLDFAIRPDPENPGGRIALLNVAALIPK